jgi:hypothetical protein
VRNPLEVADSLLRRDGGDEYRSLLVWARHMLSAERDTRDMPRCFVRYQQLVTDWRPVVGMISERLAIPLTVDDADTRRDIDAFIRNDLWRHRRSDTELFERVDVPECVKQVYRCCCAAAESGRVNMQALDAVSEALDDAERFYRRTGPLPQWPGDPVNIVHVRQQQLRRDALYALAIAELGAARQSKRQLEAVLNTRSWRFTRPFRGVAYLCKRGLRMLATLLSHRPALASARR